MPVKLDSSSLHVRCMIFNSINIFAAISLVSKSKIYFIKDKIQIQSTPPQNAFCGIIISLVTSRQNTDMSAQCPVRKLPLHFAVDGKYTGR